MNAKLFLVALTASAAAIPLPGQERVERDQLPPAVKKTLAESASGDAVRQITVRRGNDGAVYDIELDRRNAPPAHVRITERGSVVNDTRDPSAIDPPPVYPDVPVSARPPTLRLQDLPEPARRAIRGAADGREIASITDDEVEGRKAFAVQFRESGRNPWLYVAEDGTVLRPAEKPPLLGFGTTISDLSAPARDALRRQVGDGEIQRIDREHRSGEPDTFNVTVKDDHGTYRLRISDDGRVLESTRGAERSPRRG